jgi:predicted ester cyclase
MQYSPNPQPNEAEASQHNREVVRQVMKAFNTAEVSILDEVISPQIVQHSSHPIPANGDPIGALKKEILLPHAAYPDGTFTEGVTISEGDMIFYAWDFAGTNTGAVLGRPPSGKRLTLHAGEVARVKDGKVVEHWDEWLKPRLEAMLWAGQLDDALLTQLTKAGLV